MPLRVYNTLTQSKEPFQTVRPGKVGMYVCGPTVYSNSHVGHMVGPVIFDTIKRYLVYLGYDVTWVVNITDVDDKLIVQAQKDGTTVKELAERVTDDYLTCLHALGVDGIDHMPRATGHIDEIVAMARGLIEKGFAYASGGDVYFDVTRAPEYGKLSHRDLNSQLVAARKELEPGKLDPRDFALWKHAREGEPAWPSPWGRGRPGWHIECSAMVRETLGDQIDIHGGGADLIFPHHENEIAQSVCAHDGHPFARTWLHNGMLTVGGAKMAKSEGNFVTVRDALSQAPGEVIRLALLPTPYRDPLDWTPDRLHQARQTLDRWYRALLEMPWEADRQNATAAPEVIDALEDDLNAPLAISRLHDLARAIYRASNPVERGQLRDALMASASLMGLLLGSPGEWLHGGPDRFVGQINERIAERARARSERRFADADRIRAELSDQNIVLEDRPDGTTDWRSID